MPAVTLTPAGYALAALAVVALVAFAYVIGARNLRDARTALGDAQMRLRLHEVESAARRAVAVATVADATGRGGRHAITAAAGEGRTC